MKNNAQQGGAEPHARATGHQQEAELVELARSGDESAIRELIQRLNPRLFRIIRGIVDSDAVAEELVQETYLSAFTRLEMFRGEARFSTWIISIATNLARMQRRGHRILEGYDTVTEIEPRAGTVLAFPGPGPNRPEPSLGRTQFRELLESAIADLTPDFRLPFLMHEVEGISISTIAHLLQINPTTVKTRLFRARRKLRTGLQAKIQGGFDEVFPFDGARCRGMADRVVSRLQAEGYGLR